MSQVRREGQNLHRRNGERHPSSGGAKAHHGSKKESAKLVENNVRTHKNVLNQIMTRSNLYGCKEGIMKWFYYSLINM